MNIKIKKIGKHVRIESKYNKNNQNTKNKLLLTINNKTNKSIYLSPEIISDLERGIEEYKFLNFKMNTEEMMKEKKKDVEKFPKIGHGMDW